MERFSAGGQVQQETVSDGALSRLRAKFDDALSYETAVERADALEHIIAECAVPLESGVDLSPEYSRFLESLTKMQMLEAAHAKLEALMHQTR